MESKVKIFLIAACMALLPGSMLAQKATKIHDKEKYKQIRSMENGTWDFGPDLYYYWLHKGYSGASMKFRFGIPPWKITFKESKSDTKRTSVPRAAQIPIELSTISHLNHQIDSISPLVTEEVIRSAERMVDINYSAYEKDFKDYGTKIKQVLTYCLAKGDKTIDDGCEYIQTEYEAICSAIEYIHEQGPGKEMEPTKRQIAYEDARARLEKLLRSSYKLMNLADTL